MKKHALLGWIAILLAATPATASPVLLATYSESAGGGRAPWDDPRIQFEVGLQTSSMTGPRAEIGRGVLWSSGQTGFFDLNSDNSPEFGAFEGFATNGEENHAVLLSLWSDGSGGGHGRNESVLFGRFPPVGHAPDLIGNDLETVRLIVSRLDIVPWTPEPGLNGYRYSYDITYESYGTIVPEPRMLMQVSIVFIMFLLTPHGLRARQFSRRNRTRLLVPILAGGVLVNSSTAYDSGPQDEHGYLCTGAGFVCNDEIFIPFDPVPVSNGPVTVDLYVNADFRSAGVDLCIGDGTGSYTCPYTNLFAGEGLNGCPIGGNLPHAVLTVSQTTWNQQRSAGVAGRVDVAVFPRSPMTRRCEIPACVPAGQDCITVTEFVSIRVTYDSCVPLQCPQGTACQTAACSGGNCILNNKPDNTSCGTGDVCCAGTCSDCCNDAQCPGGQNCCSTVCQVPCCTDAQCNDNNPCRTDTCNTLTGACQYSNNSLSCNDGAYCNGADTCSGGSCSIHAGSPCGGSVCCEATDTCVPQCCNGSDCNDSNPCTTDTCNIPNGTCQHTNNTASCSDGNPCNGNENCSNGSCVQTVTDCNSNGFADGCDLAAGTSVDANGDLIPDECVACCQEQTCVNASPLLCRGISYPRQTCSTCSCAPVTCCHGSVCSATSNGCECEAACGAAQMSGSCTNSPCAAGVCCYGGGCDSGGAEDMSESTCDSLDGLFLGGETCSVAPCPAVIQTPSLYSDGIPKSRFLTFGTCARIQAALRLKFVHIYTYNEEPHLLDGEYRWIGEPAEYAEMTNSPGVSKFWAARVQCAYYDLQDWGNTSSFVHVYGPEIVPSSTYELQFCADDACVTPLSVPLTVTTSSMGDARTPYGTDTSFLDVAAIVDGFKESSGSPAPSKTRCLLQPDLISPGTAVSCLDISRAVDAFRSKPYPFPGPQSCENP